MKIEFKNIRDGWGTITISHTVIHEIVTYDLESEARHITKIQGKECAGYFSVSYIENPIALINSIKPAIEKGESAAMLLDAEGKDSTLYIRNIAGEYYEILWRDQNDNFGGIPHIKAKEILDAIEELNKFVEANREEIELNWMDTI